MAKYTYNHNEDFSDDGSLLFLKVQRTKDFCDLLIEQCDSWLPPQDEGDTSDGLKGFFSTIKMHTILL